MWVTIGSGEGEGLSVRVEGDRFLVGSGPESQLMVTGGDVKPLHAYFQVREDGVVELHALEGETYVNGQRLEGSVQINGGEEIRIGDTVLTPSVDDPAEEARVLVEREGVDLGRARADRPGPDGRRPRRRRSGSRAPPHPEQDAPRDAARRRGARARRDRDPRGPAPHG